MKKTINSLLTKSQIFFASMLVCFTIVSGEPNSSGSTCAEFKTKAGMPKELDKALYMAAVNEPWSFQEMICSGIKNGATVRYLRSGLFRNEGFEIKGSQPMKVYFERDAIPSSGALVLVPTNGVVRSNEIEVTPGNIRLFTGYLIAALRNVKE